MPHSLLDTNHKPNALWIFGFKVYYQDLMRVADVAASSKRVSVPLVPRLGQSVVEPQLLSKATMDDPASPCPATEMSSLPTPRFVPKLCFVLSRYFCDLSFPRA